MLDGWHLGDGTGLQPFLTFAVTVPGAIAPGWYGNAPLALADKDPPTTILIPHVGFVIIHAIFFEKHPKLVLEGARPVVLLLTINISTQGIQIGWADGKASVSSLP